MLIPQIKVSVDHRKAAQLGLTPGQAVEALQTLSEGQGVSQVLDGVRRYDVVIGWLTPAVGRVIWLACCSTPRPGACPCRPLPRWMRAMAPIRSAEKTAAVASWSTPIPMARDMGRVVQDIRAQMNRLALPQGYFISLEGQFQAQTKPLSLIAGLSLLSLTLMFLVLYSRYQSSTLALVIMASIPFALVGSVVAMGRRLALVGGHAGRFITLTGIATQRHPQDQPLHQPVPAGGQPSVRP